MRIISKFHDYYDCIQSIGYDPNLIYFRKEKTITGKDVQEFHDKIFDRSFIDREFYLWSNRSIKPFIIGIAGKIINGIVVESPYIQHYNKNEIFYESKSFEDFIINLFEDKYNKNSAEYIFGNKKTFQKSRIFKYCKNFLDLNSSPKMIDEIFIKYEVPIFYMRFIPAWNSSGHKIILNPNLKDYNFMKYIDPFNCYQEIAMYLSGVIGNVENNSCDISDKDMRDMKGFDDRSFKMDSPGKKRKRRGNV